MLNNIKQDLLPYSCAIEVVTGNKIIIRFEKCVQYRKLMKILKFYGMAMRYELYPTDDVTIIELLTYKTINYEQR